MFFSWRLLRLRGADSSLLKVLTLFFSEAQNGPMEGRKGDGAVSSPIFDVSESAGVAFAAAFKAKTAPATFVPNGITNVAADLRARSAHGKSGNSLYPHADIPQFPLDPPQKSGIRASRQFGTDYVLQENNPKGAKRRLLELRSRLTSAEMAQTQRAVEAAKACIEEGTSICQIGLPRPE